MYVSLLTVLLMSPLATAQDAPSDATDQIVEREKKVRGYQMEIGLRGRRMSIPRGIMDGFYTDSDLDGWPLPGQDRPDLAGWAYGMEFVVRDEKASGIFWFEWIDADFEEGYWDDKETDGDGEIPEDGHWVRPTKNLGLIAFGADYAYEIAMVRPDQTKGVFGMGLVVGGGLGVGFMVGDVDRWELEDGKPGYERYDEGLPPNTEKRVFRFYPLVDVNLGLRLNFGNRVSVRLEGGVHSMLYYGATVGFAF